MIRRETDPALANRLSNDPDVFGNVSYDGRYVDWTPAIEAVDRCIILSNGEDAIQVFDKRTDRTWEVMTIFAPTCRGKRALETAFAMREWMLPYGDVAFGAVPLKLRAAAWFYRKLGGKPVDHVEANGLIFTPRDPEHEQMFEFRIAA